MTHDYIRHGTTTLFAALNVLDGSVTGRCMQQHRHQDFIRFLNAIEAAVPAGKPIHAIADNYATHKHPKVRAWLARHPRWTFHFTPTSASWLNAVEGFFATLTKRRLKRGVFRSVVELQAAMNRGARNRGPIFAGTPHHRRHRRADLHFWNRRARWLTHSPAKNPPMEHDEARVPDKWSTHACPAQDILRCVKKIFLDHITGHIAQRALAHCTDIAPDKGQG